MLLKTSWAGLEYLEKQPWIDKERMGDRRAVVAAYMMNWFAVNTPSSRP